MGPIDRIRPIKPGARREQAPDRDEARYDGSPERDGYAANLPAIIAQPETASTPPPPQERSRPATTLDAQIMAQEARRRGLRGPVGTLETARSAYLETEYSGRNDRRPRKGLITKTEI